MDGLDPRNDGLRPRLPHDIESRAKTWMADHAVKMAKVTGKAPTPNPMVSVASRNTIVDVMVGVTGSAMPNVGAIAPAGPTEWLMKQLSRQVAKMVSKDVLGLYVPQWQAGEGQPGLYLVGENITEAAIALGVKPESLARYVAFHEATHQWQFTANPWLNDHMVASMGEMTKALQNITPGEMIGILFKALTSGGDLMSALPGLAPTQATMSLIEGYADFMSDELGVEKDPELKAVSKALSDRRTAKVDDQRSTSKDLFGKLSGFDAKRRQYAEGKAFCQAVKDAGGHALLNRVWDSPDTLPTPAEMADPSQWVLRIQGSGGGRKAA